jgi:uncharacterized protein
MKNAFYTRKIYADVLLHVQQDGVTIITGMRRTGKTTLVRHVLSELVTRNKIFLDLEKISNRELFLDKNYDNVIRNLELQGLSPRERMYVALDEIQTLPNIASVVKYLHDHYDIKFILTGSSSYYLKNLFTESLAGRKKLFELYPLDFGEFLDFKRVPHQVSTPEKPLPLASEHEYQRLKSYYEEYIQYGGFPSVVLAATAEEKINLLEDIISSYINVDVQSLANFKDGDVIARLVRVLASRVGTKVDYSKLASLAGLSRITVQNYVYLFERTYLISLVSVHTKNRDREIVKAQKLYFNDTGLLATLADVGSGALFENTLFNQLRGRGDVRYFSLKNGREIDFIVDGKMALEAKETPTERDRLALHGLAEQAGVPDRYIVSRHVPPEFREFVWGGDVR